MKSRSHSVHSEVLKVLLALRIKDINLEQEKKDEMKQKKFMKHKQKLLTMSKKERKVICLYYLCNLTLRLLMSYIYIYMEHLFLMFLDHTQRRSTVGRTPLDE